MREEQAPPLPFPNQPPSYQMPDEKKISPRWGDFCGFLLLFTAVKTLSGKGDTALLKVDALDYNLDNVAGLKEL